MRNSYSFLQSLFVLFIFVSFTSSFGQVLDSGTVIDSQNAYNFAAEDFDKDGDIDFVIGTVYCSGCTARIDYFINDGSNSFTKKTIAKSINSRQDHTIEAGDINGDGYLDIIAVDTYYATNWIFDAVNNTFLAPTQQLYVGYSNHHDLADINGDGLTDLINGNSSQTNYIAWWSGISSSSTISTTRNYIDNEDSSYYSVHVADFNGDGVMDVAANKQTNGASPYITVIYENDGNENFTEHTIHSQTSFGLSLGYGDFDGDSDLDLVLFDRGTSELIIKVNPGNGSSTFSSTWSTTVIDDTNFSNVRFKSGIFVSDVDGDNDLDIIANDYGSPYKTILFKNDGSLSFTATELGTSLSKPIFKDFDGDGDNELLTAYGSSIRLYNSSIPSVPPSITVTGTVTTFEGCSNSYSSSQSVTVSGSGLQEDITVTAPSGFEVSNDDSTFDSTLSLTEADGTVSTTVYIRKTAGAATSGNVTFSSTGATTSTLTVTGTLAEGPHDLNNTLNFDGTDDKVTIANNASLQLNTFTIEAWVKASNVSGRQGVFTKVVWGGTKLGYGLDIEYGKPRVFGGNSWSSWSGASSSSNLTTNQWVHLAGTYDGSVFKLYVDGVLVKSQNYSAGITDSGTVAVVGSWPYESKYFNGSIDDVRVWNTARSATEIANNKDIELVGNESGLVAYYNFNQGVAGEANSSETTLTDATSNSLDGTLSGLALSGASSNWVDSAPYIIGDSKVDIQLTSTSYSHDISGGTWSSSNTSVATINSSTGTLTFVTTGSTELSYNYTFNGCSYTNTKTVTIVEPSLSVSSTLTSFNDDAQQIEVSGDNLRNGITVVGSSGFEVSTSTSYSSNLTVSPTNSAVATTTIYVKMTTNNFGTNTGTLSIGTSGVATQTINLTGYNAAPPTVESFSPVKGIPTSTVTITGVGFDATSSNNVVRLNGMLCEIVSATTTKLIVKIPSGTGNGKFTVTNLSNNLSGTSNGKFNILASYSNKTVDSDSFEFTKISGLAAPTSSKPKTHGIADYDDDGKMDVAYYTSAGIIKVLKNNSSSGEITTSSFSTITVNKPLSGFYQSSGKILSTDLNNDGKIDLAVSNGGYNGGFANMNASTSGTVDFGNAIDIRSANGKYNVNMLMQDYDINSDGKMDFIGFYGSGSWVYNSVNTSSGTTFSVDTGDPSNSYYNVNISNFPHRPYVSDVFDVDGDGKVDMVYAANDSALYVYHNKTEIGANQLNFSQDRVSIDSSLGSPLDIEIADINRDGLLDVIAVSTYYVKVYLNTSTEGNPSFTASHDIRMTSPYSVGVFDVDGDEVEDIVVGTSLGVYFVKNTTVSEASTASFETPVSINNLAIRIYDISIADVDKDGKLDIIGNYGTNLYILRNKIAEIPEISVSGTASYSSGEVVLSGNITDDGGATVTDRGMVISTTSTPTISDTKISSGNGTGSFTATYSATLGATYYVRAFATNANITSYGSLATINVPKDPSITSFSPLAAGIGQNVVITGSGFTNASSVSIGGTAASSYTVDSDTQITAVVASGASAGNVTVVGNSTDTKSGFALKLIDLKFENNVLDETDANKDGIIVGSDYSYSTGASGQSFCFDNTYIGDSNANATSYTYLKLPNELIRSLTDFTISLRFKTTDRGGILGYQQSTNAGSTGQYVPILYVMGNGKLSCNLWQGSMLNVTSSSVVNDGNWHKVEFTATAGSIQVYLDGEDIGSSTGTVQHLSMSFNQLGLVNTAGVWPDTGRNGWSPFNGCVDEFFIVDSALTAEEITETTALPPPTITTFTPSSAANGETITITGTNLSGATSVKFGTATVTYTAVSSTTITATMNSNVSFGKIQVITAAGTASTTNSVALAEANDPVFQNTSCSDDWSLVGDVVQFGKFIDITPDGTTIALGEPNGESVSGARDYVGTTKIFKNISGVWTQLGADIQGEYTNEKRGSSVALSSDGTIVAIGARYDRGDGSSNGTVKVYQYASGSWSLLGSKILGLSSRGDFGKSIALSDDGSILAVGASGYNPGSASYTGKVTVYEFTSGDWSEIYSVVGSDGTMFGESVALSSDGTVLSVGANGSQGNGFVYKNVSGTWSQLGSTFAGPSDSWGYGTSTSLSSDGTIVAFSGIGNDYHNYPGVVDVFEYASGSWSRLGDRVSDESIGMRFGWDIALSDDGNKLVVGASLYKGVEDLNAVGKIGVYSLSSGSWSLVGNEIKGVYGADVANAVAISSDGGIIATSSNSGQNTKVLNKICSVSASYDENQTSGSTIASVTATDDVAIASYAITSGNSNRFFAIDNQGNISLTSSGVSSETNDYETGTNTFTLTVKATDYSSNTTSIQVILSLTDLDEEAPAVASLMSFSYQENQSANYSIGTVTATDNVGITSYSITSGNSSSYFSITASGVLKLTSTGAGEVASNDYESGTNTFTLVIEVSDAQSNTSSTTVSLNITNDVNDDTDTDNDGTPDVLDTDDDGDGQLDTHEVSCGSDPLDSSSLATDTDSDGIPDCEDSDIDGDGIPNTSDADQNGDGTIDNGPDTDGDGTNDANDPDIDGDGIPNASDVDPDGDGTNDNGTDTDGDGTNDANDPDIDGDGIPNGTDSNPTNPDQDGDGILDGADVDIDGDGTNDNGTDTDGDGINNANDTDDDGDGVLDVNDAFPLDSTESVDTDSDGTGNNADTDDDNDGILDVNDDLPLDSTESVDTDGDGTGNNADTDDDGDGVLDTNDAFPLDDSESLDTDSDGTGNNADTDDDNDGVLDVNDAFPLDSTESVDTDSDGTGNNADTDDDGDGVLDVNDAFPLDGTESVDTDGDGTGDNSDPDIDGDGILNGVDVDPDGDGVLDNGTDFDGDGINDTGDTDDDNDGVLDVFDAFPKDASESLDTDNDGIGNNVDTDDDGDGLTDAEEAEINTNPLLVDTDNDGVIDSTEVTDKTNPLNPCSLVVAHQTESAGMTYWDSLDCDNDGVPNGQELSSTQANSGSRTTVMYEFDTDGDGIPNYLDPDDDGDGVNTIDELMLNASTGEYSQIDTDGDTTPNYLDTDDDNDGISTAVETTVDSDSDGIPNYLDTDDDGDGVATVVELSFSDSEDNTTYDSDGDGIPNYLDTEDNYSEAVTSMNIDPNTYVTLDTDGDGIANINDNDDDNDGFLDSVEINCNTNPLRIESQPGDYDDDGIADCIDPDMDGDGVDNINDQFPMNPFENADNDNDGIGDNLDADDDNDGVIDAADAFPLNAAESADVDSDGIGDNADTDLFNDGFNDSLEGVSGLLTPNTTGIESTWKIANLNLHPYNTVSVFDKDGKVVFQAQNYKNDWDGSYKDSGTKVPSGSYYYKVHFYDTNQTFTGWLFIAY